MQIYSNVGHCWQKLSVEEVRNIGFGFLKCACSFSLFQSGQVGPQQQQWGFRDTTECASVRWKSIGRAIEDGPQWRFSHELGVIGILICGGWVVDRKTDRTNHLMSVDVKVCLVVNCNHWSLDLFNYLFIPYLILFKSPIGCQARIYLLLFTVEKWAKVENKWIWKWIATAFMFYFLC